MEALRDEGQFRPPTLDDIERSFASALAHVRVRHAHGGRVFVDLWELHRFADPEEGESSFGARRERLRLMNIEQHAVPDIERAPAAIAGARGEVAS